MEFRRVLFRSTERDGAWGERAVEQIRVLEPGRWSLWRRADAVRDRPWRRHAGGETSFGPPGFGTLPLVTVYAERTGYLTARPPLLDLAWLNLAHWQSSSDQRHILHVEIGRAHV